MTSRLLMAACAVAVIIPGAQALAQKTKTKTKASGTYERSVVEVAPASKVRFKAVNIDNRLGNVKIIGGTGPKVVIEAVKRAADRETLERLKVSLVSDPDGNVRIGTSIATGRDLRPIQRGTVRIDLIVRAPNNAKAVARVWNGKLAAIGMENGADLTANEGDIEVVNGLGAIVTKSAQGKQRFARIVGTIDARGLIGDMEMAMIGGRRLAATVHNGNIVGRKVRVNELALRTMKGNIELHAHMVLGGKYRISTYEGNIRVTFGNRVAMRVRARAPRGDIKLPSQLKSARRHGAVVAQYAKAQSPAMLDLTANVGHIAFAF